MFTGLIGTIGTLVRVQQRAGILELGIRAPRIQGELKTGDSIAVNGVCLTVTQLANDVFTVGAVPETQKTTTLKAWKFNEPVNLELALSVQDRLHGHWVSGHVDGTAQVEAILIEGKSQRVRFSTAPGLACLIARKGSVTLDGVSLTVAEVFERARFEVALIPETLQGTTLGSLRRGSYVNLEVDLIARYLQRLLAGPGIGKLDTPGTRDLQAFRED